MFIINGVVFCIHMYIDSMLRRFEYSFRLLLCRNDSFFFFFHLKIINFDFIVNSQTRVNAYALGIQYA